MSSIILQHKFLMLLMSPNNSNIKKNTLLYFFLVFGAIVVCQICAEQMPNNLLRDTKENQCLKQDKQKMKYLFLIHL